MHHKDTRETATGQALAHVERAKVSLKGVHAGNLSIDGVFFNPPSRVPFEKRAARGGPSRASVMHRGRAGSQVS